MITPAPQTAATPPHARLPLWLRTLLWLAAAGVLALVFAMYLQADFMILMADQMWACF